MDEYTKTILIVDDDPAIRRLFRAVLSSSYAVREAASGEEALEVATLWSPDVVLLDIMMPGINGYETCQKLKKLPVEHPPQVIMASSKSASAEQVRAFAVGADDYLIKPVDPVELRSRVELHFRLRESEANTERLRCEVDGKQRLLKQAAQDQIRKTLAVQDVAVFTLAQMAETRDKDTGDHIERMREYTQRVAIELQYHSPYAEKIDEMFLADLYRSSPLHDIGKIGIPDAILLNPSSLSAAEFEVMKTHTNIGGKILHEAVQQTEEGGFLSMATLIAQFHHERWDGKGYPAGLTGSEIPLPARIVSVADVFDALTSVRPYKEAWSATRAKQTIDKATSTQFDPVVVKAFDRCFGDILDIQCSFADKIPTVNGAKCFQEYDLADAL